MIDHLLGRPSSRLKRIQVLLVLLFWGAVLRNGPPRATRRLPLLRRLNKYATRFAPWQVFLFALTSVYAIRHVDALAGFGAPEPLAHMYSRPFYRVTWINTALDAGFATAMPIRPKFMRDLASILFSIYYIIYANEADEKLRRFRAFCTVDFMRTTWNKTTNPYIRLFTWHHRPSLPIAQSILIPRPRIAPHNERPIKAYLFYSKPARALREEEELVVDFVGGGFVCMDPRHHEERLRQTAKELQKPVLAVDYCKAPEFPFPYALEECFDLYRSLFETGGSIIGMSGRKSFRVILTGDSAGGNLAAGVVLKVLEYPQPAIRSAYAARAAGGPGSSPPTLPRPIAVVLNYPALNFGFTSWMKPEYLTVLRSQSQVSLQGMTPVRRRSTLSDKSKRHVPIPPRRPARKASTTKSYVSLAGHAEMNLDERAQMAEAEPCTPPSEEHTKPTDKQGDWVVRLEGDEMDRDWTADTEEAQLAKNRADQQKALQEATEKLDSELDDRKKRASTVNTRLTMTSMAGYFQDRILTQSMMRAMAILYIGPRRQPDFDNDYFLSPVVAPAKHLAEFPPILFTCGEKDPICDDTVVMAGRIRQAKLARQAALKRRGAPFGEQLRMSGGAAIEEDQDIDDWVQMRIIEGWSHGYLQMSSLLPEAKRVISSLAAWMEAAFTEYNEQVAHASAVETPPKEHRKPFPARNTSSSDSDDEPLSFTPKSRRSPSLASEGGASSPKTSSPSTSSASLAQHSFPVARPPMLSKLADRERPSSFSHSTGQEKDQTNGYLPPPAAVPLRRRRSMQSTDQADTSLVMEQQLLERRRQDAINYIGGAAAQEGGRTLLLPRSHPQHTDGALSGQSAVDSDDTDHE